MTGRVEVVGEDCATFLRCGDRERAYASKDVCDKIALVELVDKPFMFGMQSRVPVDLPKVKRESTVILRL